MAMEDFVDIKIKGRRFLAFQIRLKVSVYLPMLDRGGILERGVPAHHLVGKVERFSVPIDHRLVAVDVRCGADDLLAHHGPIKQTVCLSPKLGMGCVCPALAFLDLENLADGELVEVENLLVNFG